MASRVCWNCDSYAHHTSIGATMTPQGHGRSFCLMGCDNCGVGSIGIVYAHPGESPTDVISAPNAQVDWIPQFASGKTFPDVPKAVAEAANEAHRCLSIQARPAAVLMARSVVEATAKDKGVTSGTLAAKIDALQEREHLSPLLKEMAHEIRYLGNDMAHGDFVVEVDANDAAEVLAFMDELLAAVYQHPARLTAFRAQREARKAEAG